MASHLFTRDRASMAESKRRASFSATPSTPNLPSPFGDLGIDLSDPELRETAYEILLAACRSGRPLSYVPQPERIERSASLGEATSLILRRSLTSGAASKVKKALGMKAAKKGYECIGGGGGGSGSLRFKRNVVIGEVMRAQMRVLESTDSRIRRGLLKISSDQPGKRMESMVLPLELLKQLKYIEFPGGLLEYETWKMRNLKVLEAGLLLHPRFPLDKTDTAPECLRRIIKEAMEETPLDSGKISELRTVVMSLARRSFSAPVSDTCHWADGVPLNLRLYQMLLEACFDSDDEASVIEEVDEALELIKKTWVMLGINQMLHNLCFTWVLFLRFLSTGQVDSDLLYAADNQLAEVAKDARAANDPVYGKILCSTLSSILGWAEKRLLIYHDIFHTDNIYTMQSIVSLSVLASMILSEDIVQDYCKKRKEEGNVAQNRIDTYIRSSIRAAFAQKLEKANSSHHANPLPVLSILAKETSELATIEKELFSPVLKKWHPLATGVAVATLHACYGNELKQFISGITELTPDIVQSLRAADKLEKNLVQIAVEESVDSEDGGKSIIHEMPPYEAETAISDLVKDWIKIRVDVLKEWIDRNLEQEVWNPRVNKESFAPSAVELLRIIDETLSTFFQLPMTMHTSLLPDLMAGLDKCLLHYIVKTKSKCGSRNSYLPTMPALTRCTMGSKFGVWKKKEKFHQRKKSQVGSVNGDSTFGIPQLCVRISTLQHIRAELELLEKRIITYLRNAESVSAEDIVNTRVKKFEQSPASCLEGIQQLSEAVAYKVVFHDLSHVLWDGLYVGDPSLTRIGPMVRELEKNLEIVADTVHSSPVRTRVIADIMKASFEGFLLVLLAGGPSRSFTKQDSQFIEDDFKALKDIYWSNGDGLPEDLIDRCSKTVREVLPLFRTDTESIIERFTHTVKETYGHNSKSRLPLPPTSGHWSPTEPNTLLRVLCYRHDEEATKFLKKTYNLPKKL